MKPVVLVTDLARAKILDLLNEEDFPNAGAWFDDLDYEDPKKFLINLSVAREPIDLMN